MAAGYNSIGIVSSGGAGYALSQWINTGEPPFDLWDVDIRRAQPFQRNRTYLRERVSESLGLLYADHFPYRQPETARGVRRTPIHEHLKARGAPCFGETAGWERANWFARDGVEAAYTLLLEAAELVRERSRRAQGGARGVRALRSSPPLARSASRAAMPRRCCSASAGPM